MNPNMVLDASRVFDHNPQDRPSVQLANGKYLAFIEMPETPQADKRVMYFSYGALATAVIALVLAGLSMNFAGGISEDQAKAIVASSLSTHKVKAENVEGLQAKLDASSTRLAEAVTEEVGKKFKDPKVLASAQSSASAGSGICEALKKCNPPSTRTGRTAPPKAPPAPRSAEQVVRVVIDQRPATALAAASVSVSGASSSAQADALAVQKTSRIWGAEPRMASVSNPMPCVFAEGNGAGKPPQCSTFSIVPPKAGETKDVWTKRVLGLDQTARYEDKGSYTHP